MDFGELEDFEDGGGGVFEEEGDVFLSGFFVEVDQDRDLDEGDAVKAA